jgi:hypothetical protein
VRDVNFLMEELTQAERERARAERILRVKEGLLAWLDKRRPGLAMSRHEIGAINDSRRTIALFKATMVNAIVACRENPRADTRLGVLAVIACNCDNESGSCTLSIKRMAEVLHRKEDNIRAAIKSLEGDGLVGATRTSGGMLNRYWIVVPRSIAELNPHVTWIIDAISPRPARSVNVVQDANTPADRGDRSTPPLAGGIPPAEEVQYFTTCFTPSIQIKSDQGPASTLDSVATTGNDPTNTSYRAKTSASSPSSPSDLAETFDPSTTPVQVAPASASKLDTPWGRNAQDKHKWGEAPTQRYNITFDVANRLNGLPEYVHEDRHGQRTPVSQMTAVHADNAIKPTLKAYRKAAPELLDRMDTAYALLSMKQRLQKLGADLPKGMPSDEELHAAVKRWLERQTAYEQVLQKLNAIEAVYGRATPQEQARLKEDRATLVEQAAKLAPRGREQRAAEKAAEAEARRPKFRPYGGGAFTP